KDLAQNYARGGVTLAGLTPPRLNLETLPNDAVRTAELDVITRIIEGMGEAQIPFLHFYLNNKDAYPTDPEDQEQHWKLLMDVYRELTSTAERCSVKVSTHHYHAPGRPLWNFETMSQLFDEVDSPANGVIFCQGKSELAGDPLAETVLKFQDKVFMVHIRDIVTHIRDSAEKELHDRLTAIGYLEVGFGTGECDMPGTIRSLKQIGYTGQLYPEHFPTIAGDRAAGLAWCIGYIRALDQMIDP
ncbi:MAG: TIM barrel protein, partial [bacterium]|nr:TIM barrel protein [bacterium]